MKKCLMCQEGLNELITLRKILFLLSYNKKAYVKTVGINLIH